MASQRKPTDTDIREPESPTNEMEPVSPSVDGPTEGVSTLGGIFGPATVVDQVEEVPYVPDEVRAYEFWVIRPNTEIEDMTLGVPIVHMSFKAGVRYKVPRDVAYELCRLDFLMEMPFPYDERVRA